MVQQGSESGMLDATAVADTEARRREVLPLVQRATFSKSDWLMHLSHEMRTPLSAILGFAQLIDSGRPSPSASQKRSIDRILEAGWYLDKLINMTRDLALIESGTLPLSLEAIPLASVVLDCQTLMESQAQGRGVRLTFLPCETACAVSADRVRLQQVLGYWLSAAIEYSEVDEAVVVDCDTRSAEWIRIGIRDGGGGSSRERPAQHCRPVDSLEKRAIGMDGVGIGLLLAERLVELMGGAIDAQSTEGTRNVFSFSLKRMLLPLAASRTNAAATPAAKAIEGYPT